MWWCKMRGSVRFFFLSIKMLQKDLWASELRDDNDDDDAKLHHLPIIASQKSIFQLSLFSWANFHNR